MPRKRKRKDALVYKPRKKCSSPELEDLGVNNDPDETVCVNNDHSYHVNICTDKSFDDCVDSGSVSSISSSATITSDTIQGEVNPLSVNVTEHFTPDTCTYIYSDKSATDQQLFVTDNECYTSVTSSEEILSSCEQEDFQHCVENVDAFQTLRTKVLSHLTSPYSYNPNASKDVIQIVELYPSTSCTKTSVKLSVNINEDYNAKVFIHGIELFQTHSFWLGLPNIFNTVSDVDKLLDKLSSWSVCIGNCEVEYQELIPTGSAIQCYENSTCITPIQGYREGDFGAVKGDITYTSTIRSTNCELLVNGARCSSCSSLRQILYKRQLRQEEKRRKSAGDIPNYISKNYKHCYMSRNELIGKIVQQKQIISSLQCELGQIKRKFQKELGSSGVNLDMCQSLEMKDTMATCTAAMEKAYPDANCFQRLFWEEQFKSLNVASSKGMRWHPMIIRWCLYLRQKSSAAYDALRDSGFVTLPSSRTLFDYSHYTKSANGFQADVLKVLQDEVEKKGMNNTDEPWKSYVGILFDEIKVKSELVYDKHTGELIGYCNLDKVGNQMMEAEKCAKNDAISSTDVAKFMLVLMIRGVATDLKFPFAGFSTMSITADFLYPIVWKAVRILETSAVKLKVLFVTCDGASANRRFIKLHGPAENFVYYTINPYASDQRKLFFVSDVPHLIKTTRNCFANSYSHKNTRKLWKEGKDISWMHVLNLFEEHCENSLFTPCPKLTRSHLDMTAFSCMKVNLAAQVLSSTVGNALEMMYDDHVSETVNFIRIMNRFFDCLNVRSLYEGRNSRNPDLNPYTSIDDERLSWLKVDFLEYFDDWEQSVLQRQGQFSKKERQGMTLSHQTLAGLKITANSIVDSVVFLLQEGCKFVLTHTFNQDPLEQQFGHYRHRAGDNNNPTVYDVRHMMTQMRAVGAQALEPVRGNIKANRGNNFVIDHSILPKRQNLR